MTAPLESSVVDLEIALIDSLATIAAIGDLLASAGHSDVEFRNMAAIATAGEIVCREAERIHEVVEQLVPLAHRGKP